ncbi:hypothetical protein EDC01DRAFT_716388 [Geopyxis carbonaria]|nr:hypothetical protein EDC01DRAFT_716388 [Geopyxis carbonaria]
MIGRAATSQDLPTAIIAPTGSATATATASSGSSKTKTVTSAASSPTGISTDSSSSSSSDEMPVPFDGAALSANLTSACSTFLKNSLSDSGFLDCLPLSMLLQNSDSFFQVLTESAFTITKVIDKTCSVNANKCTAIMDKFSGEITTTANCASDYQAGNPIVTQVYNGLVSYLPMYEAGCLKSEEGNYCYVEAITNSDTPGDGAVYFLPLGTQLSSTQEPSCSKCLVQTMSKFAAAATNTTQPLSHSYNSAADQINTACGDNTVKAGLEIANSAGSTTPAYTAAIAVVLMIAMYIL